MTGGGQSNSPYTTSQEVQTAAGMGKLAAATGAKFALALGDNFYDAGVQDVTSVRFKGTFEDVFSADSLQAAAGFTFHVLAGNHDHKGNVTAQVDYSAVSKRWDFPSLWYTFTETAGDGTTVQYVMIDTVVLTGQSLVSDPDTGAIVRELNGRELPGAADAALANAQLAWIEATLKASTADFLVVAGHYPVYSICEHGPTPYLQEHLKPLLQQYKVTAYMNGHDHCAEHIAVPGDSAHVDYHTIGSAHENSDNTKHESSKYTPKHALKWHTGKGDGGFATVAASKAGGFVVAHYDGDGKLLYTAPARQPRSSTGVLTTAVKRQQRARPQVATA